MKVIVKYGLISLLVGAAVGLVDCGSNQTTTQTPGSDPAAANVAPAQGSPDAPPQQTSAANYTPGQAPPPGYDPGVAPAAPAFDASYNENDQQYAQDQTAFDEQPVEAAEPPPPLPDYSQPPAPGDGYLWNPGYWAYSVDGGYYWTPGVWVIAPWVDALWTPPYWDFFGGHYRLHHGYWASHVGFYGGVNYGFGYTGRGYEGGYWNNGSFAYNTTVTNVNRTVIHNVYNHSVTNYTPANHVAYNGGRGGINERPTAGETAVLHEQRTAPVSAQVQHVRQAAGNREQFASVNHGRPATVAAASPLATPYRAPAARPEPAQIRSAPQNGRPAPQERAQVQPQQAAPMARGPLPQNENRQAPNARQPEVRPAPYQPAARPAPEARPEAAARPAPVARPEPAARPAPAPRPEPAARPAPAPAQLVRNQLLVRRQHQHPVRNQPPVRRPLLDPNQPLARHPLLVPNQPLAPSRLPDPLPNLRKRRSLLVSFANRPPHFSPPHRRVTNPRQDAILPHMPTGIRL